MKYKKGAALKMTGINSKVTASHLARDAYLYVRQSTLRQVVENTESTKRQYALRHKAKALGWPEQSINVIDCDLGQSGASSADRKGFQKLVSDVSLGKAGIVLGLEVSRLARNNTDWNRLLEICALSDTLILDEDGLYNPNDFNDRLLLGLKGTMSEAELHLLRSRLRGGIMNKAKRGELSMLLPVGFVYDDQKRVRLDPDEQVRQTLHLFFKTFKRTGSARMIVKEFRDKNIEFPRRILGGPGKGTLVWGPLIHSRTLQILHNPRYAGAFCFGRRRVRTGPGCAKSLHNVPRKEWYSLIVDAHEGYITWEEFEKNEEQLKQTCRAYGKDRRKSPPREGPALLQGLVLCGVCGCRMTVRYHHRSTGLVPDYVCQKNGIEYGYKTCSHIPGAGIDKAIGDLLIETLTPAALDVSLTVQKELSERMEDANRIRSMRVQRQRYEADLARRRYMSVDPENRLVAEELELEWNEKLRILDQVQQEYEAKREADSLEVDNEIREKILQLSTDFPRLWNDQNTTHRDRKRMIRLIIEDVTLVKKELVFVYVRFKGGATKTLELRRMPTASKLRKTAPEVIQEIDLLLDYHTDKVIAAKLNEKKFTPGVGKSFNYRMVGKLRRTYNLKSRFDRLREKGMLTLSEYAEKLKVSTNTVLIWRRNGLVRGIPYNEKNECLFEPPGPDAPKKMIGRKLSERAVF